MKPLFDIHRQLYPFPFEVNAQYFHRDVLMDGDHFGGIGDESVGKLGEMDKSVFLDAYVHESTEIGDIADDTGKHHAFAEVIDGANVPVEFKNLYRVARVTSRFIKLLENIFQSGEPYSGGDILFYFDTIAQGFVGN